MSTYEEFMIILATANLITAILTYTRAGFTCSIRNHCYLASRLDEHWLSYINPCKHDFCMTAYCAKRNSTSALTK